MFNRFYLREKVFVNIYADQFSPSLNLNKQVTNAFSEVHSIYVSQISLFLLSYCKYFKLSKFSFDPDQSDLAKVPINRENLKLLTNLMKKYKINWTEHPDIIHEIEHQLKNTEVQSPEIFEFYSGFFKKFMSSSLAVNDFFTRQYLNWEIDFEEVKKNIHFELKKSKEQNISVRDYNAFFDIGDKVFCQNIVQQYLLKRENLDEAITETAKTGSRLKIQLMERLLIMLAVSEYLAFKNETPVNIIISQYLTLAERYNLGQNTPAIHSICSQLIKQVGEKV